MGAEVSRNLILRTQKNGVLASIQQRGLSPSAFSWDEVRSRRAGLLIVSRIVHTETGYFFLFDFQQSVEPAGLLHYCQYSPAETRSVHEGYTGDWDSQRVKVVEWLLNLTREISAPDLWATIESEKQLVSDAVRASEDNTPFTLDEQKRIRIGVHALVASCIAATTRSCSAPVRPGYIGMLMTSE